MPVISPSLKHYTILSKDNLFAYVMNPKTGNTTVVQTIYYNMCKEISDNPHDMILKMPVNNFASHLHRIDKENKIDSLSNFFKFSSIRDPFERFVSGFIYMKKGELQDVYGDFLVFANKSFASLTQEFEYFIRYTKETEDKNRNLHFMSQSAVLDISNIDYDFFIKGSSFNKDIAYVFKDILGLEIIDNLSSNQTGSSKFAIEILSDPINKRLANRVKQIFEEDYEVFQKF